jgi:HEAT repeat protein
LKTGDEEVRVASARSLGLIRDRRAVGPLAVAIKDPSWRVRRAAVHSLGQIADVRAVTPLIAALGDDEDIVVLRSAWALGEMNDPRAIQPLVDLLFDPKERPGNFREQVADALSRIRDPQVIDVLIMNLKQEPGESRFIACRLLKKLTGASIDERDGQAVAKWKEWRAGQK